MRNIESSVQDILDEIGVPRHIPGGPYLREAICIAVDNPDIIDAIDEMLYPQVAKNFRTTPRRVGLGIQHAIEIACDRGNLEALQCFFGSAVTDSKCKPSNSEFIAIVAERIRLEFED